MNVFDDGRHTYFQFDPKTRLPAIFMVHPDETESLVNAVRRGRFLVVHDIGRQFTLRNGPVETCVFNEGFHPEPVPDVEQPPRGPGIYGAVGDGTSPHTTGIQPAGRTASIRPGRLFRLAVGAGSPAAEYNRPPGAEYGDRPTDPTARPPARSEYNRRPRRGISTARRPHRPPPGSLGIQPAPPPRAPRFHSAGHTPLPRPRSRAPPAAPEYDRSRPPRPPPRSSSPPISTPEYTAARRNGLGV